MIEEWEKIFFRLSFNGQMSQIGAEIDPIIALGSKSKISQMGRAAYGEPGCASSIKYLFEIIKSDPKNKAVLGEICQAEQELTAFLFDEPNAPSEQEIVSYWKKYLDAFIAEVQAP